MPRGLPRATVLESLRLTAALLPPGTPHARPGLDLLRSRSLLTGLQIRYGGRPVLVRGPRRTALVVLSQRDAERVLSEPAFVPAVRERAAGLPCDVLRPAFTEVAREEAAALTEGVVDYARLEACWQRVARRCVYGAGAAGDEELSTLLAQVRRAGRGRARRRQEILSGRYDARILDHLRRAEPGTLAGLLARTSGPEARGLRQAAFWLMGFSVTAASLMRTLALLATYPAQRKCARADSDYLRACLREGLRLWPPVPALSRISTEETDWYGVPVPAGTHVLLPFAPHQRSARLPYADSFAPEIWLDGTAADEWWALPRCDGVHLMLAVGTAFLGGILASARPKASGRPLSPHRPLPQTLNAARLRVTMRPLKRRPAQS
ncbi:cytochrome P450 [Nonomuraea spiralis]|uniref:Cytochrome P450 n=1 Tax=Nonomuraea spiralis TaxID=46182 RepID=A0ABV5IXS0_9ACTN|nr:cytochrome P450 [Nonomuraea spiralis]GGT35796.1 hypothetical protein GCM10010176_095060 [Nonomuraea spiralis]